ncbi:MAG: MlaD family protein [Bacteroidales bacterium]|jgi:phospholipid/cholesterol/gamma-HCH transport system substrate-binding protein|nr:MlaD family protein [Bacteroidales bacterium]
MKISKETKIGAIFIVGAVLLIWGYSFLKGQDLLTRSRTIYAVYQNVSGLGKANPVFINGMQVGQVTHMYFDPVLNGNIIVGLTIDKDFPIPKNSNAEILSTDLMGTKAVNLNLGSSTEMAKDGDTLTAKLAATLTEQVEETIGPLKKRAEILLSSIDEILISLNAALSEEQVKSIKGSIAHLNSSLQNADTLMQDIGGFVSNEKSKVKDIIDNIESITDNFKNNNEKLSAIITNFHSLSDTLVQANIAGTLGSVNKSMSDFSLIMNKINKGEGSVGLLINNDSLYIGLEKSSRELNLLLEDIRLNPKKYVKFSLF